MSRSNKAKGSSFETAIVGFFRDRKYATERLARRGSRDEGDVAVAITDDVSLIIEAKNVKAINLSDFINQSEVEAANYSKARGDSGPDVVPVVVVKRRMKGVDEAYVVTTLTTFEAIISRLLPPF
jgi:Holliday junction resolvase